MRSLISSLADASSILYEGRANLSDSEDKVGMAKGDWKHRLKAEIDRQEKSQRSVSKAAGLGPGVVNSWINDNEDKDPQTDSLIRVCQVLGVSLSQILYGFEISGETEEILDLLEKNPHLRQPVLQILKTRSAA